MKPLRHTVPLGVGETPPSFTSRLAAMRRLSGRDFCLDFGTTFQAVVDGDPTAIAVVAAKGGVDPNLLSQHAFLRTGKRRYTFRGEVLVRSSLRRAAVAVCPDCLASDIAAAPHLRPAVAAFGRALCQIDAIRTCPVHSVPLAVIAEDLTPHTLHDFSHHVGNAIASIGRLAGQAEHRLPTDLENYVIARLDGGRHSPFLDSLELHAAIKFAEMTGAVELFGRTSNLKGLSDEEWRRAGASGFEIVNGGPVAIGAFLSKLQATFDYGRSGHLGPQALYGRLFQWLAFDAEDPAYNPVRDLVGKHIIDHLPLGPGDKVFDQMVVRRALHSIRTLHLETGLHPKRLRKLLRAAGIVKADQDPLVDANVIFPSGEAYRVATRDRVSVSLIEVGRYLNLSRVQRSLLVEAGFLKPSLGRTHGKLDQYATADLDEFLKRLLEGAVPIRKAKEGQVDIRTAAKRACCSAAGIVGFILDMQLKWVGRSVGVDGYQSVLVDLVEIRELVRGDGHGGLTQLQIAKALKTTDRVVRALIANDCLVAITVINPVNKCPQQVVLSVEVERFDREFVSLFALAKQRRQHFLKLKQEFDEAGVEPVFDVNKIGATFYRRKDR
jgi:hypothetical protein